MTAYGAALLVEEPIFFETGLFAGDLGDLLPNPGMREVQNPQAASHFYSGQPIVLLSKDYNAQPSHGVLRHFLYDHVYITPNRTNLGPIIVDTDVLVYVWNAFLDSTEVSSLTSVGDDEGVSVLMPATPPFDMYPLEQDVYTFTFDSVGPATIALVFTLTVGGEEYLIYFDGLRSRIWTIPHNWKEPVEEWLEWLTDYTETWTGKSTRASLRSKARRGVVYRFTRNGLSQQLIDTLLFSWQSKAWAIPVLFRPSLLTAATIISDNKIYCDTADKGFTVGDFAVIRSGDSLVSDMYEIESITATYLTTVKNLIAIYPTGYLVFPAGLGRVSGNVSQVRRKADVIEGEISFSYDPLSMDPWIPVAAAAYTHNGTEVMLYKPDWVRGINESREFEFDTFDYETGVVSHRQTSEYEKMTVAYDLMLKGITEIVDFRGFLGRVRGMWKAFYAPSWKADLTLAQSFISSATTIKCLNNQFAISIGLNINKECIFIELKNGTRHFKNIIDTNVVAGLMELELDSSLGVSVAPTDVVRISFMQKYTLASDKVVLQWHSPKIVTVRLPLRTVPE